MLSVLRNARRHVARAIPLRLHTLEQLVRVAHEEDCIDFIVEPVYDHRKVNGSTERVFLIRATTQSCLGRKIVLEISGPFEGPVCRGVDQLPRAVSSTVFRALDTVDALNYRLPRHLRTPVAVRYQPPKGEPWDLYAAEAHSAWKRLPH